MKNVYLECYPSSTGKGSSLSILGHYDIWFPSHKRLCNFYVRASLSFRVCSLDDFGTHSQQFQTWLAGEKRSQRYYFSMFN